MCTSRSLMNCDLLPVLASFHSLSANCAVERPGERTYEKRQLIAADHSQTRLSLLLALLFFSEVYLHKSHSANQAK